MFFSSTSHSTCQLLKCACQLTCIYFLCKFLRAKREKLAKTLSNIYRQTFHAASYIICGSCGDIICPVYQRPLGPSSQESLVWLYVHGKYICVVIRMCTNMVSRHPILPGDLKVQTLPLRPFPGRWIQAGQPPRKQIQDLFHPTVNGCPSHWLRKPPLPMQSWRPLVHKFHIKRTSSSRSKNSFMCTSIYQINNWLGFQFGSQ